MSRFIVFTEEMSRVEEVILFILDPKTYVIPSSLPNSTCRLTPCVVNKFPSQFNEFTCFALEAFVAATLGGSQPQSRT